MGIPSLFRTIIEKYSDVHYWDAEHHPDHLYLDYNCLIHHCKAKLKIAEGMALREVEEELIAEVIKYTSHIVTEVVKPRRLVHIAIDGSVPMGKLVRQRARRYKKVQDDAYRRRTAAKLGVKQGTEFDSNKITPGTPFMFKLASRLKNFAMIGAFSKHIKNPDKQFKIFISDANITGEGEQKIMSFMRNGNAKPNGEPPSVVVYGLDADLIILSMLADRHIRLLREPQNTTAEMASHDTEFIYLDIDRFTDCMIKEYGLSHYDRTRIIKDFAFATFFGGNDFVEPFVHTKMRDKGFDKIMTAYTAALQKHGVHLMGNDGFPNKVVLQDVLLRLADIEDSAMKHLCTRWRGSGIANAKPRGKATPEERLAYEMQLYEHSFYTEKANPFHEYYADQYNAIDFKEDHTSWKESYNRYYFAGAEHTDRNVICEDYLRCLAWTWKYYTDDTCPSWLWVYRHRNAPLCSEFAQYIASLGSIDDVWESSTVEDEPLAPVEQLIAVLPPQNAGLLPFAYQIVMKDRDLDLQHVFPQRVKLDVIKGLKNIYSDPILPDIDVDLIRKMTMVIPVSEPELSRNTIRTRLFCFKV